MRRTDALPPADLVADVNAAATEAEAWDSPARDLRDLGDAELEAARDSLAALRARVESLTVAVGGLEPARPDLVASVALALRRAVYGWALADLTLRTRRPPRSIPELFEDA